MRPVFQKLLISIFLLSSIGITQAEDFELSQEIPSCQNSTAKPLPEKYYFIAKKWNDFNWVKKVTSKDVIVSESGYERIDGSGMRDWFNFGKLDINGDGICDWFLTASSPLSSGGDRNVLNTLYLGSRNKKWHRIGAEMPNHKPDILGAGKSNDQQDDYTFSSETPFVLWDKKSKISYFIGYFYTRTYGKPDQKGYEIYIWNAEQKNLQELDKWEKGSAAEKVYAYFKQHGAVDPTIEEGENNIAQFDQDLENSEIRIKCMNKELLERSSGLAERCKISEK